MVIENSMVCKICESNISFQMLNIAKQEYNPINNALFLEKQAVKVGYHGFWGKFVL